jgi:1-phosphatidylinositol phosphodiesterase
MVILSASNWLSKISDNTSITDLSIPGTHDTMTIKCDQYTNTQTLSFEEQLEAGVRFFDMRLTQKFTDEMVAAHRSCITNFTFYDILGVASGFLKNNPSEFIIMRIQNANENKDDFPEYTKSLHSVILQNLDKFYFPNKDNSWPNVGNARGKIIAVECNPKMYDASTIEKVAEHTLTQQALTQQTLPCRWAYRWHDNDQIVLQDYWDSPEVFNKLAVIKEHIKQSSKMIDNSRLYLNHISATNGKLENPIGYASVINAKVNAILSDLGKAKDAEYKDAKGNNIKNDDSNKHINTGVLIFDFITHNLSQKTYSLNTFQKKTE